MSPTGLMRLEDGEVPSRASGRRRQTGASLLVPTSDKEMLLVHSSRHSHIEEANHHLVIGLVAPHYRTVRVGIVHIVSRIVVPGNRLQRSPSFHGTRFCQAVAQLPVEIVVHAQHGFDASVSTHEVVLKPLAPKMHMREETQ